MARPPGRRLHAATFRLLLRLRGEQVSDVAAATGVSESTIFGLLADTQRASDKSIRALSDYFATADDSVLFPSLGGFVDRERVSA